MRLPRVIASFALIAALVGCSAPASTYQQRMDYLRKVAQRGADTHTLIASQEALVDKARCERAYDGFDVAEDAPALDGTVPERNKWTGQVKEFFVDSCISGKPKPVPGDPTPPSGSAFAPSPSR
jgi:hypothetical protein